eukprot:GHUV01035604.1.p2 GENE.GHUV01035604.1~~GHUV01035604.1.p2  ORF type:complete len:137 (-),score=48.57 GHUV01035604.1:1-411(-)
MQALFNQALIQKQAINSDNSLSSSAGRTKPLSPLPTNTTLLTLEPNSSSPTDLVQHWKQTAQHLLSHSNPGAEAVRFSRERGTLELYVRPHQHHHQQQQPHQHDSDCEHLSRPLSSHSSSTSSSSRDPSFVDRLHS